MLITDSKKLSEIQREFREKFPYLKLEFYDTEHKAGQGNHSSQQIESFKTLGEVRRIHGAADLTIHPQMKVKNLEQLFAEHYGLNVQVFRNSGNIWLQTTATDDWTLHEQNRKGGSSEKHFHEKQEESDL